MAQDENLLGYATNTNPLSISQDQMVRAPKALDTRVSVSPTDNGYRTWDTIGKGILAASNAISTIGNGYANAEKRAEAKKRLNDADRRRAEAKDGSTAQSQAEAKFVDFEVSTMGQKLDGSYDSNARLGDFKELMTTNFGNIVDGTFVADRNLPIYEGLSEEYIKELELKANNRGKGMLVSLGNDKLADQKFAKEASLVKEVNLNSSGAINDGVSVVGRAKTYLKGQDYKALKSLNKTELDIVNSFFKHGKSNLKSIYKNAPKLQEFLKVNKTDDENILNNTAYIDLMSTAQGYLTSVQDSNKQSATTTYKQIVNSGGLSAVMPLMERAISNATIISKGGTPEQPLTGPQEAVLDSYMQKAGAAKGYDGSPSGYKATLMDMYNDGLKSVDVIYTVSAVNNMVTGNLLPIEEYEHLSSKGRQRIDDTLKTQTAMAIRGILSPVNDTDAKTENEITSTQRETYIKGLEHYSTYPGQNKTVLAEIGKYKIKAMQEPDMAIRATGLAKLWSSLPERVQKLIPTKEQVDYSIATFITKNPQFIGGYTELQANPDGMVEALKIGTNADVSKTRADAIADAGGYDKQASDYFNRIYALTKDSEIAETETKLQFGMVDIGFKGVTVNASIKDKLVGAGIHSSTLAKTFIKQVQSAVVASGELTSFKDMKIVDIYGSKTKIQYLAENGGTVIKTIPDAQVQVLMKKVQDEYAQTQQENRDNYKGTLGGQGRRYKPSFN